MTKKKLVYGYTAESGRCSASPNRAEVSRASLQRQIMEGVKIRMENNFQREVQLGKDHEKPLELKRHQQYHGRETEATNHLDRGLMFMVIIPRYYTDNENASCATFE